MEGRREVDKITLSCPLPNGNNLRPLIHLAVMPLDFLLTIFFLACEVLTARSVLARCAAPFCLQTALNLSCHEALDSSSKEPLQGYQLLVHEVPL